MERLLEWYTHAVINLERHNIKLEQAVSEVERKYRSENVRYWTGSVQQWKRKILNF